MNSNLAEDIAARLKELGYRNVESNCGTVWYEDADGNTWSICPQPCEDGEGQPAEEPAPASDEVDERKRQIYRDLLMKRYSVTRDDEEKWAANFAVDLEAYAQARVKAALFEKDRMIEDLTNELDLSKGTP